MQKLAWLFLVLAVVLASVATVAVLMNRPPTLPVEVTDDDAARTATAGRETHAAPARHDGFLYGRVTGVTGRTYEGRLRFGGREEAFWSEAFNGFKQGNPWAAHAPAESEERLTRPFMSRLGDIVRIEAGARELRVALKSGTVVVLDRMAADDLADGIRVWDAEQGVFDFHEVAIRRIEFLPTPRLAAAPYRLHGTVRTTRGAFTGFIQWNRRRGAGTDTLDGRGPDGEVSLPFDIIRSIAKEGDGARVTLLDDRTVSISRFRRANRGLFVADPRYGRVLVSPDAFERVDFAPAGSGPGYDEFPPGRPLSGTVTTRDGRELEGRLVFDLDESETTDSLDAPSDGVDYTIRFGLIASIERPGTVALHGGEQLQLESQGDLGPRNGGMLIFSDSGDGAEAAGYVAWEDVRRIEFDSAGPVERFEMGP